MKVSRDELELPEPALVPVEAEMEVVAVDVMGALVV